MYSENLEKLIEFALADGDLSEKEKQVLYKKAESEGIDLDEFEMVLDGRLFEKQKSIKSTLPIPQVAPKSDKSGDVKKCPACGAIVQSFQTKCTDCGHEFRNMEIANNAKLFFEKFEKIENQRINEEKPMFGGIGKMLSGAHMVADTIAKQKCSLIQTFPIPNSKEDMLEFLSMALPYARQTSVWKTFLKGKGVDASALEINGAFRSKCEQIVMKARFSMKDDKKTLDEINYYAKEIGIK